jgi:hypothetical protein
VKRLLIILILSAGCAGGAGGGGLGSNDISQAQYDALHIGEPASQVRAELGKPESITASESAGMGKYEAWVYGGPGDSTVFLSISQSMSDTTFEPTGPMVLQDKTIG